ncbi:hypothetical protein HKBW3S47_00162 [Candidatus Hakubella thermalkaliphila]|uniref:Uncharacterized protein n=2 Tax=Candidatus Hakubella thermalkaliphila TaxID=2754717 RepID=A0A6V8P275_9ACTN|nr:hypothetical protein HKBW3S33_00037 [Candidatus Hakubella thermalkaliphila]GFP29139.1 hypothetical protein HKBW3S34_00058 [Candidatus Hakubella thermalkaliphila]GFP38461.1 hypothetical protein HKBW3S47_00162 [Candidatus Hakubella thermalkaliphila]GFP41752.1 hypothetical protein HKBW3C_00878 [Candidatus Hakubella thermalkaliphila]
MEQASYFALVFHSCRIPISLPQGDYRFVLTPEDAVPISSPIHFHTPPEEMIRNSDGNDFSAVKTFSSIPFIITPSIQIGIIPQHALSHHSCTSFQARSPCSVSTLLSLRATRTEARMTSACLALDWLIFHAYRVASYSEVSAALLLTLMSKTLCRNTAGSAA